MAFYVYRPTSGSTATIHVQSCLRRKEGRYPREMAANDGGWYGPFPTLQYACRESIRRFGRARIHSCISPSPSPNSRANRQNRDPNTDTTTA